MKNKLILMAITSLIFVSCEKDLLIPVSSFRINSDTLSVLKIATSDEFDLTNKSINSDSLFWDFGDGRTSNDSTVRLSYPKSGTYILKLTVKSKDGETSVSSKKVIVLDRVLRSVEIDNVDWDPKNLSEAWPGSDKADIFFQMQMFTNDSLDSKYLYPKCPVLYTSYVVKNVPNHYYQKTVITITTKIIIEKNFVKFAPGNLNNAYLFSIMAIDSNGKIYRLANNASYGFGFGFREVDLSKNICTISGGYLTNFKLICDFE